MAFAIPVMLAVSAAAAVAGTVMQGRQQSAQYAAQAQANQYNAMIQRQNADIAGNEANAQEEQMRRVAAIARGRRLAGIAESGTGFEGNTELEEQNENFEELDALNIRYGGQMRARGLLAQANVQDWEGNMNSSAARSFNTMGIIGAIGQGARYFSGAYGKGSYGRLGQDTNRYGEGLGTGRDY